MIAGNMIVGQTVTVKCSVEHTCPTMPPTLHLNIALKSQSVAHSFMSDGTSKTTLTATMIISIDHQTVQCTVKHHGRLEETANLQLNADCVFLPLIVDSPDEFKEGQPTKVTCTASYTCAKHTPTITWNRDSMPVSTDILNTKNPPMKYVSTLTFTALANDDGRYLTCNARFPFADGQTQDKSVRLRVKRNMRFLKWSFTTPRSITGMRGSCIIIPCQFTYTVSQPAGLRIKWYSLQGNQNLPVYGETQGVIAKFRRITTVVGSVETQNCSLKIERLEMSHNQERLYPWVDKNPITVYHTEGQNLYDKTTQLIVSDNADKPQLSITGIPRVGEQSMVTCSVQHTCVSSPPTLTIKGIPGADTTINTQLSDKTWERKVERIWTVREEDQSVECTVSYPGGQESTSNVKLNVECPYQKITMTEPPGDVTEGRAKSVICSVLYECKKNLPTIEWNYKDLQSSSRTNELLNQTYQTVSNLTFIGSLEDDGKSLTCTAQFLSGMTSDSSTIIVKKYERPFEDLFYQDDGTGSVHLLEADVPFRFSALTRSCVLIPCSFQSSVILSRGMWSKINGGVVYHNGKSYVVDHFKGRTKMPQDLSQGECSLEIDDIKPFDSGPFCFHAEKGKDKYSFNTSCVFIVMKASPEKPVMSQVPAEVDAGSTINVSCSVTHTCASHPPDFSWNVPNLTSEVGHTQILRGVWQMTSLITFMAEGGDGVKPLTCTATFWRGKQQASTLTLTVKGTLTHKLRTSLHISIPVIIGIILAVVCGGVIFKKRKNLQKPPARPEKRRSLMERLAGLSRSYRERNDRPPRPEKRRSLWKRFSRAESRVNWQNDRKPRYHDNVSVEYLNNASTVNFCHHTKK
ncbi:uncharacterized protein LOC142888052 isoform X3 [Nelusetta ayraudi]